MTYDIIHKNSTAAGTPPAAGEIEVGEIAINAADAALYTKDTAGNIKKFANTDTTEQYSTAAGIAFTHSATAALQRTVKSKLEDIVSVKDFGAVGDGATDDYFAFSAAATYCNDNNFHSLLIPPGNYHLSEIWRAPAGGSYVPCATIAYGAVVDNSIVVSGGAGIQGLTVDGAADCGFCFLRGQGSYHSYLVAKNCGSYGVYFGVASRQHLTVNNAAGFQVGELVTGGTSGATGAIERIEGNVIRLVKCNLASSPTLFTTESISGSISGATTTVTSRGLPLGANYQVTRATFDQVLCYNNGNKGFYWDGTATANRSWMNATCWISPSSVANGGKGWEVASYTGPNGTSEHNYNTFLNINCEGNSDKSLEDVTGRQNTYIGGHFVDIDESGQSVNVSDSFNFQLGGRYIGTVNFNGPFSIRNMQTGAIAGSISGLDSFRTNAFQADGPAFMPSGWSILPGSKISVTVAADNQTNHLIDVDLSDFISGNYVMFRLFIGGFRNQAGGYNDFDHAQLTGQMSSQAGSTVTHAVNYAVASAEGITVNSVSVSTAGVVTFDITTAQQIFSLSQVFEYYDTDSTDAR
jgi:hypothetical protein